MVFDKHISELRWKTFGTLMYANRIKEIFDKEIRTTVIQTPVLNTIHYGMAVWGTANKTQVKRVKKITELLC